ncbi:N-6 DNA methylase [Lentzea flaviverrucosa]|uniref:site-specific DNA-methyltransferase (adenine-specific) n=1 Tax=Lentzea flaviverrucosa TaxID=200379 RepID=A0A1H9WSY1_9PSEU|nr:N-6 DNA methylase [Lentzea flaviverrucosa]RDI23076.1 N-6 DNA methylase [Lentzea flaviverrucosa]SES37036.1 N-6 DNA Methylase [Lentzea flaviverrucosa]
MPKEIRPEEAVDGERERNAEADRLAPREERARPNLVGDRSTNESSVGFIDDHLLPGLRALGARSAAANGLERLFEELRDRLRAGARIDEALKGLDRAPFSSDEDVHKAAALYESLLEGFWSRGNGFGEYYTPRSLIHLVTRLVAPTPGESVLNPAAGTGGFLTEVLDHFHRGEPRSMRPPGSVVGVEERQVPYLLSTLNLALHGANASRIHLGDSLSVTRHDPVAGGRFDVVLANPPFGGTVETAQAFPERIQTRDRFWLFVVQVLDLLKPGGRCGLIVPNAFLFADGVGARIKERLLKECELHTVVRLPGGLFAPNTAIPVNLVFFKKRADDKPASMVVDDDDWATQETWFYEVPPRGRKAPDKATPMGVEGFDEVISWSSGPDLPKRVENDRAWSVPIARLRADGFNLDLRRADLRKRAGRSSARDSLEHLVGIQDSISAVFTALQADLGSDAPAKHYPERPMSDFLTPVREVVEVAPGSEYRMAGLRSSGRGLIDRGMRPGSEISYKKLARLSSGQVVFARLSAWEGGLAIVPDSFAGAFVSDEYRTFAIDREVCDTGYLENLLLWQELWGHFTPRGSTGRMRVAESDFLAILVPMPELAEQRRVAAVLGKGVAELDRLARRRDELEKSFRSALLGTAFGGEL